MQQRRLRLGDTLDDYCPRERRLTNHAIVAIVGDEVKQTRCTTCDADHEYKQGKMPALRRKKDIVSAAYQEVLAAVTGETAIPAVAAPLPREEPREAASPVPEPEPVGLVPTAEAEPQEAKDDQEGPDGGSPEEIEAAEADRVHRRLIRATLPRPENHVPERPIPEFTMRQPTERGGKFRSGMARGIGPRLGGGRGGGNAGGRGPVFGRPSGTKSGGQGSRSSGRHDVQRPHRGGPPGRHGKKPSK